MTTQPRTDTTPLTADTSRTQEAMTAMAELALAATKAEMHAAAHVLALTIRQGHPDAATVTLEASDQGDWLTLGNTWTDASGVEHPLDLADGQDDAGQAVAHLYTTHLRSARDAAHAAVPGVWETGRRGGVYVADLDLILSGPAPAGRAVEALVVRDPDGEATVDVCVLGERVEVEEFSVDAGRGWTRADWDEHVAESLARATPGMRGLLEDAFADPPGEDEGIDDFDDTWGR